MNRTRTNPQYDVQSFDEIRNLLIDPQSLAKTEIL